MKHPVEVKDVKSAKQKAAERLAVVRTRSDQALRAKRCARKASIKVQADELIESFVSGIDQQGQHRVDSDEKFWCTLDDRDWDTPLSLQPVDAHCEAPARYGGLGRWLVRRLAGRRGFQCVHYGAECTEGCEGFGPA